MAGNAGEFIPIQPKVYPSTKPPGSVDSSYWKSFLKKDVLQQFAGVTCIDFCPEAPHDFAVTSSTRVCIYDGRSCKLKKTISKFKDVAYSGHFRSDGQIIAAGGETGIIQVIDVKSGMVLRQLKGHGRPVRLVRYAPQDKLHLLSGSDDSMVKWWDVTTQEELLNLEGHKDYVRCGAACPSSTDLWATGSYDHTVRLWDLRNSKTVLQLKHGKPLEDVLFFPSGGLLATAGGNIVKVWDIRGGGRLIHMMESHQKTVMSMCISKVVKSGHSLDDAPSRLVTASLDGYMKVFDLNQFRITHSAKYPAPLLSMGVSPSCNTMAIGTSSGLLFIRQRKKQIDGLKASASLVRGGEYPTAEAKAPVLRSNQYRYFIRGQNEKPLEGDYFVKQKKKVKVQKYDKLLRRFHHTEALVHALKNPSPKSMIAFMEELVARKMLLKSVANLNGEDFELLIKFLRKYVTLPRYTRFLVSLTDKVLNLRAADIGNSQIVKQEIREVRPKVTLVVRMVANLGNYDYILDWEFQTDGLIRVKTELTGILMVKGTNCKNVSQISSKVDVHGTLLAENTIGVIHDHFLTFYLDMDIDGRDNSFVQVKMVKHRVKDGSTPRKSLWTAERHIAETEKDAQIKLNLYHPSEFHMINPLRKTKIGNPVGYKIVPGGTAASLLDHNDPPQLRGSFTNNQIWITPYNRSEEWAGGLYSYQSQGDDTLATWSDRDRPIEKKDIVL